MKNVVLAALAAVTLAAQAAPQLQAAQSELQFSAKQMGVPIEGKFKRFDAQLVFDPKKPEAGKVSFTIEMGSATLGAAEFDAELVKTPWFNAKAMPQASFVSTAFKPAGPGKFEVAGKLTIKGVARDVVVPVQFTQSGANATATGQLAIKRLDFKIGEGEWADTSVVANDVNVKFKLAFTGL
ncbi:MAG: YceI family protein [Paucibacter sp.]|nr:YceI family protein [Roseateles sp.]